MGYIVQKRVDGEFDEVVERTIDALEDEGFGVLYDLDSIAEDVSDRFERVLDAL